jgi:membrane-associated protease RseP (regulator of RpoE activity)
MHESRFFVGVGRGSRHGGWKVASWVLGGLALVAGLTAGNPAVADEPPQQPFVPGDISVGDPIVLPSTAAPAATAAPPAPPAALPATAVPGNGWVGLAVAESRTPGRWVVAEVVPDSPAAVAGVRVGDDVRAINGTVLRTADDVAQSLTAIAPGQAVSVAIARDEAIADVRMTAVPRPAPQPQREWQAGPASPPPMAEQPPAAPVASVVVPPPAAPAASAFAAAPETGFQPAAPLPTPGPARFPLAAPTPPPRSLPAAAPGRGRTALGVRTMPIDPAMQSRFRLPAPHGAYVIGVVQDLPAARAGLPPGSVIVALDERPVGSPDELTRLVTSGPVGRPVSLEYVLPGGEAKKADVVLQPLERPLEQVLVGPEPVPATPTLLPSPSAPPSAPAEAFPYRSNRPVDAATLEATRAEIRRLRARLDELDRLVGPTRD